MKVITKTSPDFLSLMISLGFGLIFLQAQATAQTWPQWGGPQRNFMTDAKGLAESWPAAGPKRLWSRELGEGHSSIIVDADRPYTIAEGSLLTDADQRGFDFHQDLQP